MKLRERSRGSRGSRNRHRRVRYAVVGLGHIAQVAALPAFAHARKNSQLVALVSDDEEKRRALARRYDVSRTFSYAEYDECLRSGDVDAVYIALPNSLHREYTVRAARHGVHVLCEKPMAVTADDCRAMIAAAEKHRIKLMIAYRLHFEKTNLRAIALARSGKLGTPRLFDSVFTMQARGGNIRLEAELGGGPLYDIGIYCINAARNLFGAEPEEVLACTTTGRDRRFEEVEEMASAILRFPGECLATFTCSFGASDVSAYRLVGTKGSIRMDPAYEYVEDLRQEVVIDGRTSVRTFRKRDQFAPEFLYFSSCILDDREPEPSGTEGLNDVRIIEAIHRAAESGMPQKLRALERTRRPRLAQEIHRPPVRKPRLVKAASGSR
jgi:predicted dehydrogenase